VSCRHNTQCRHTDEAQRIHKGRAAAGTDAGSGVTLQLPTICKQGKSSSHRTALWINCGLIDKLIGVRSLYITRREAKVAVACAAGVERRPKLVEVEPFWCARELCLVGDLPRAPSNPYQAVIKWSSSGHQSADPLQTSQSSGTSNGLRAGRRCGTEPFIIDSQGCPLVTRP
jgi:hypothetical protein